MLSIALLSGGALGSTEAAETAMVEQATAALEGITRVPPSMPDSQVQSQVQTLLDRYVDFTRFEELVLADAATQLSAAQRKAFSDGFRTLIIRRAAARLRGQSARGLTRIVEPPRTVSGQSIVRVVYKRSPDPQEEADVELVLVRRNGTLRIADAIVDGASLAQNYRASVNKVMRRSGAEGVLARVRELGDAAARPGERTTTARTADLTL